MRLGRIAVLQTQQIARLPACDFAAHGTGFALAQKHVDQVLRTAVAKQLAFVFFMETNTVFFDQINEILRGVAAECATREHGVVAKKMRVRCSRVNIFVAEVAAPAA